MRQSNLQTPSSGGYLADDEASPSPTTNTPQGETSPNNRANNASRGSRSQAGHNDEAREPVPPSSEGPLETRLLGENAQDNASANLQPSAAAAGPSNPDLGDTTTDNTDSEAVAMGTLHNDIIGDVPPSAQEPFQSTDIVPAVAAGNHYAVLLTENYRDLLRAVWNDERDKRSALLGLPLMSWWEITIPLLATVPGPLLNELMIGNISLAARGTGPLADILQFGKANSTDRPAVYSLALVDERSGEAPTPNELREMLEVMAKYPLREHDQLASEVDAAMPTQQSTEMPALSRRKYLVTGHGDISPERENNVEVFRKALTARLDQIPAEDADKPMSRPLQRFGWTIASRPGDELHLRHDGFNYIMGLTESIFRYLNHHHLPNNYRLDANPICFMWEPEHPVAGEILFTCIGDGYIENGGGFSYNSADQNNNSADIYNTRLGEATARFVRHTTAFCTNMRNERQRLEEDVAERKRLKASIQRAEDLKSRREEIRIAEREARAKFKESEKEWPKILEERRRLEQGILPPEHQARIDEIIENAQKEMEEVMAQSMADARKQLDLDGGIHKQAVRNVLASGKPRSRIAYVLEKRRLLAAQQPTDEDPSIYDIPPDEDEAEPSSAAAQVETPGEHDEMEDDITDYTNSDAGDDAAAAQMETSGDGDETDYTGSDGEGNADSYKLLEREES
ncbi:hypothetical protein DIS24_g11311 [Lasiodiplodia hormozganensis]|uniref:Uncharacterized protein n=1 Tax=Lasiodiplodia hormozganensis TaxID=869390 RepID=A0AA39WVG1_9PEZI|nr:hypothetical protein DIS24_g11311 [Lasiodiplodia hormozganensis]